MDWPRMVVLRHDEMKTEWRPILDWIELCDIHVQFLRKHSCVLACNIFHFNIDCWNVPYKGACWYAKGNDMFSFELGPFFSNISKRESQYE